MNMMVGGLSKIEFDKAVSFKKNVELFRNIDQRINAIRLSSNLAVGPRALQEQYSLPEKLFDSSCSIQVSHSAGFDAFGTSMARQALPPAGHAVG